MSVKTSNIPLRNFKRLELAHKISLVLILLIALSLPITTFSILKTQVINRSGAQLVTPPSEPTPTIIPGKAVYFDGVSSHLEIPGTNNENPTTTGFTIEMWVKPDNVTFSSYLLNKRGDNLEGASPVVTLVSSQQNDGTYKLTYGFDLHNRSTPTGNCYREGVTYSETIPSDQQQSITSWRHIAIALQPGGTANLFVNGEKTSASKQYQNICESNGVYQVGILHVTSGLFGPFKGAVDELRISNNSRYSDSFVPLRTPFENDLNTVMLFHFEDYSDAGSNNYIAVPENNVLFVDGAVSANLPSPTEIPPTQTPSPTNTPSPTVTPTPYILVVPNSVTNKSCNDICTTYELICSSVGTDQLASNMKSWQVAKGSCIQQAATCTLVTKKTGNKICGGIKSPWTNCKCTE